MKSIGSRMSAHLKSAIEYVRPTSTREIHYFDGFNDALEAAAKLLENLRDCDRLPTLHETIVYIRALKSVQAAEKKDESPTKT